jgi:hypothetical protein
MKARKGEPILCVCGRTHGKFLQDVQAGEWIMQSDFELHPDRITVLDAGFACRDCEAVVGHRLDGDRWEVRIIRGAIQ